jgi:hypothetical protein
MTDPLTPPTDVPADADPVVCPSCDRPFADGRRRALHVGEVHGDEQTDEDRAAFEEAREGERDEMWLYHFKVVVVLLALYMVTGLLYLVALG